MRTPHIIETKQNNYRIRAIVTRIDKKPDKKANIHFTMEMKKDGVGLWDTLNENYFNYAVDSLDVEYDSITNYINRLWVDGYFKTFVERYEWTLDMFDMAIGFSEEPLQEQSNG